MPRHQQVTTCRRSGGPILRRCTCDPCNLPMCAVCGACAGALTTDCPGSRIPVDKQGEVLDTCLDYTDDRGWHQGARMEHRSPRFTNTQVPPAAPRTDPRTIVAPAVDWTKVDQNKDLQHELTLRAIAWTLADRQCDDLSADLSAALVRAEGAQAASEVQANFQRACQRVEECDDEFRQAARKLVAALEDPADAQTASMGHSDRALVPTPIPSLLEEIQGSIKAEHLPRTIDRLENAIVRLFDVMPPFVEGLPLAGQLGEEIAFLRAAAREACRQAEVPWTSKIEQDRWKRWMFKSEKET